MSGRLGSVEAGVDAVCFRGTGFAAAKFRSPYRSSSFMVLFMAMHQVKSLVRLAKCKKGGSVESASKREHEM
eukprot:scaffold16155_cov67-Skeletonema_dohrnii-CCMP3373.AAC.3